MNKPGFTLIEILFVVLISSMLSVSLWQMFKQISRSVDYLSKIVEIDQPLIPFYNQLELDITGMFVAQSTSQAFLKKYPEKEESSEQEKAQAKKEKAPEENYIKNLFYINAARDSITLSFITTNGIRNLDVNSTESKVSLKAEPLIKRVAYILEPDPKHPNVKRVMYKSSDNLNLDNILRSDFNPTNQIFSNVKDFNVELSLFEPVTVKPGEEKKESQKRSTTIKEWSEEEVFKKYKALIPAYITIRGSYTDLRAKLEYPFEFKFKVEGYQEIKEEKKEKTQPKAFDKMINFFEEKFPQTSKQQPNPQGQIK